MPVLGLIRFRETNVSSKLFPFKYHATVRINCMRNDRVQCAAVVLSRVPQNSE